MLSALQRIHEYYISVSLGPCKFMRFHSSFSPLNLCISWKDWNSQEGRTLWDGGCINNEKSKHKNVLFLQTISCKLIWILPEVGKRGQCWVPYESIQHVWIACKFIYYDVSFSPLNAFLFHKVETRRSDKHNGMEGVFLSVVLILQCRYWPSRFLIYAVLIYDFSRALFIIVWFCLVPFHFAFLVRLILVWVTFGNATFLFLNHIIFR